MRQQFFTLHDTESLFYGPPIEYTIPLRISDLHNLSSESFAVVCQKMKLKIKIWGKEWLYDY